jgi:hypothetical protein
MQWAYFMPSYVTCLVLQRHDFRKKVLEYKVCVLVFFTNLSATFLILRSIERNMTKNVCMSSCKVPVILVIF